MKTTLIFLTVFLAAVTAHSQSTTTSASTPKAKAAGSCTGKSRTTDSDLIGGVVGKIKDGLGGLVGGLENLAKSKIDIGVGVGVGGKGQDSLIGADIKAGAGLGGLDTDANIKAGKGALDASIKAGLDTSSGIKGKVKTDVNAGGIGAGLGVDVGVGAKN